MKTIPLSQGKFAIVDDEDFDLVSTTKWHCHIYKYKQPQEGRHEQIYAKTNFRMLGHPLALLMHRLIMDAPKDLFVDHINHNGLDNRRCNLRLCTASQNQGWRARKANSLSPYKGVRKKKNRWVAKITWKGNRLFIGSFKEPEDAAIAYDAAAQILFGEFAYINGI